MAAPRRCGTTIAQMPSYSRFRPLFLYGSMSSFARSLLSWPLLFTLTLAAPLTSAVDALPLSALKQPGRVLMLRHALAPGVGDPAEFQLNDCTTQRNLDAAGRAQARSLGEKLAHAGITEARVLSSQWCRCLETARLLSLGEVQALPALNSFYQRPEERDGRIDALRAFFASQPVDGPPIVLVTHQVTLSEFTHRSLPSLGGTVFQLNGTSAPQWLGTIESP